MDFLITFLNSQFVSSMIGAILGAGVAVYVAKLQNNHTFAEGGNFHERKRTYFLTVYY